MSKLYSKPCEGRDWRFKWPVEIPIITANYLVHRTFSLKAADLITARTSSLSILMLSDAILTVDLDLYQQLRSEHSVASAL